jgi:hypothetical protein
MPPERADLLPPVGIPRELLLIEGVRATVLLDRDATPRICEVHAGDE